MSSSTMNAKQDLENDDDDERHTAPNDLKEYCMVLERLAVDRDLVLNNLGGDCGREVALVHAGPVATGCLAERHKGRMRAAVDDAPCHNGLHRYH
ncbi:unnamed protein product [Arctia plantaginis]|uniref:Uncharacterized protein n=1 Tax=Arctia plantaginis TaxID=874455 RepID=A0A8S0Z7C9_ARCPL|nr:unnamed protein product [Arctia plantaginis]CAB3258476.1 unnamed protein product [Arctia plantaginis]